jgi:L-ascorbate peroxidase
MKHGANAGLAKCVKYLQPLKDKYSVLSWADLIQMAGATAVEHAGGPKIAMRYGRVDASEPSKEGALPGALAPWAEKTAAAHLRAVFGRMGMGDREIVALSGAHTIGRALKERSGTVDESAGKGTKFTMPGPGVCPRFDKDVTKGMGMPGGRSWTQHWLTFDNAYFTQARANPKGGPGSANPDGLLWLPTDAALTIDPKFAPFFALYARSQEAFFQDYAEAHRRLSEVGAKFFVPGGIMVGVAQALLLRAERGGLTLGAALQITEFDKSKL